LRSHFVLDGLHCAACAPIIERALRGVPGVTGANVNAARRRAVVDWTPGQARPSALVAAVRRAGYQAYPDIAIAEHAAQRLESRRILWRLGVALFCMMQVMMYASPSYGYSSVEMGANVARLLQWASWLLCLPVLLFAATPFYAGAWGALKARRIGMDVPVVLGLWIAFAASTAVMLHPAGPWGREVYFDSVTMLVSFLLLGRWLEGRARAGAEQSLESVLHRLPAGVERLDSAGRAAWVAASRLRRGDRVRVAVGQAFAGDGVIVEGHTEVDEALLTGEWRPLPRGPGEPVLAGALNLGAPVVVRIDQLGAQTQYERVVALMRQAMNERPAIVRAADRLAGPFLWSVLLLALAAGAVWWWIEPARAIGVTVAVLIVTCPCALSLAAPSALIAAASALARRHVLVQRLEALEALAHVDTVCFDKTGTLTEHLPTLRSVQRFDGTPQALPAGAQPLDEATVLQAAAALAAHSLHPLSQALVRAASVCAQAAPAPAPPVLQEWADVHEVAGQGLEATDAQGRRWRLGSADWVGANAWSPQAVHAQVWFGEQAGVAIQATAFTFDEALRDDARDAVRALREAGLALSLLSGDRRERVEAVAQALGIDHWRAGATPADKLADIAQAQAAGHAVAVVGDGINDAPVLARADVSFAMGHGAALAQARADFLVMNSRPGEVAYAQALARRTLRVVRQNFLWAVGYNLVGVPAAAMGWVPPWLAGLGMALSSLVVVLNALRLSRYRGKIDAPARPGGSVVAR
jgi:Cu2+-exporting ATPase